MAENILITVLSKLLEVCKNRKIKVVLMGGMAVSVYAGPRATYDIDGVISIKKERINDFLSILKKEGFSCDKKEPIKFIRGLSFITLFYTKFKTYVDLFVADNEFQKNILVRAKRINFNNLSLNIISPEDLILIKLQAGREQDIEDIRNIISENRKKIDFKYLKKWAGVLNVQIFLKDELESLGVVKK